MATLTIRNLSDEVRNRLRVRAARHGRSMEAEAREVLAAAVSEPEGTSEPEEMPEAEHRGTVREVKAASASHEVEAASLVDELIAERRIEAWKDILTSLKRDQR